jgi:alanyl-tRNA synthetase
MTVRLYNEDSYLREFTAVVLECRREGKNPAVILDQTAFYPTSGGQPHDIGTMGPARVLDVIEDAEGAIVHVLDTLLQHGPLVARLDWNLRFDHMQQHTGQHILSQAFLRIAGAQTVSFHMGEEVSTVDIALASPPRTVLDAVEKLANTVVFEDRPVRVLTVERDQLGTFEVRKESYLEGTIRIIDVGGFDRSPCGGTHVRRSGEIGVIFVLRWENYKGGARVEFVCGERARKTRRKAYGVLEGLGQMHSCGQDELLRLTEKVMQDRSALARENQRLQDQILESEALELLRNSTPQGTSVITKTYSGRTLENLKALARRLTAHPDTVAILGLVSGEMAQIVAARSAGVPLDCGSAIKRVAAERGGKGGGKPEQAQAGGIPAQQLQAWMQTLLATLGP